jgi:cytidylate kinase
MPVVVISGEPQSGSSTAARLVAKKLNLRHWSVGDYIKSLAQRAERETARAIEVMSSERGQSKSFHEEVDAKTAEEAKKGGVVIDGKLAVHFIRSLADLAVWLACPFEERARRASQRDGISMEQARKLAKENERIGRETYKRIYGFDYFGQKAEADLVIDTSKAPPEQVAAKIVAALEEKLAAKRGHKIYDRRKFL